MVKPKTIKVQRKGDPEGDFSVVNVSDFDAETMTAATEPASEPKDKDETGSKKGGRPPGSKNKPKDSDKE